MPILATQEEISNLKQWTRTVMEEDKWIPVNEKEQSAFKQLMIEWYGWPEFTINFNRAMDCVMKIKL